jgi:hypothetical protein
MRGSSPRQEGSPDRDLLKNCYYHINSLNDSIRNDEYKIIPQRAVLPCELPQMYFLSSADRPKIPGKSVTIRPPVFFPKLIDFCRPNWGVLK